MSLLGIVVTLIVIGVLLWLVQTYVPMAQPIKTILMAVVVICVVLWLLNVFGLFGAMGNVGIPGHGYGGCR